MTDLRSCDRSREPEHSEDLGRRALRMQPFPYRGPVSSNIQVLLNRGDSLLQGSRFISGQDGVEKITVSDRALPSTNMEAWSAQLTEVRRGAVSVEVC